MIVLQYHQKGKVKIPELERQCIHVVGRMESDLLSCFLDSSISYKKILCKSVNEMVPDSLSE